MPIACKTLLPAKVFFTGLINPADKPDYFAIADLFVHPHTDMGELTEGWGLVINEAASMSLPIITTDRVGSAPDLVINGENGYIAQAGNIVQLSEKIEELLCDETKLIEFSLASRRAFEKYHRPAQIPQAILEAMNG